MSGIINTSLQPAKVSLVAPDWSEENRDVLFMWERLNDSFIWHRLVDDIKAGPEKTWELTKTAPYPPVNNLVME